MNLPFSDNPFARYTNESQLPADPAPKLIRLPADAAPLTKTYVPLSFKPQESTGILPSVMNTPGTWKDSVEAHTFETLQKRIGVDAEELTKIFKAGHLQAKAQRNSNAWDFYKSDLDAMKTLSDQRAAGAPFGIH